MAKHLILDLETTSTDPNKAELKVFGGYDVEENRFFILKYDQSNHTRIQNIVDSYDWIITFNGELYDNVILKRYNIEIPFWKNIDLFQVCKKRPILVNKTGFKSFSLKNIIKTLKLDDEGKGEIDYKIFQKSSWTKEEQDLIVKYLKQDLLLTAKLWKFMVDRFAPFAEFISDKGAERYKHITSSAGAYSYKVICNMAGIEEEYPEKFIDTTTFEGAFVSPPTVESAKGLIVLLDFKSLYPSIFIQFNLYSHSCCCCTESEKFSGNSLFHVKGKYCTKYQGDIEKTLKKLFNLRLQFQEQNDNRELTIKVIINCFDKDTQIFTTNGIKNIKDVKVGDSVYSLNPKTLQIEIKPIIEVTKRKYDGIMHNYETNYFDFKITPEHKLLIRDTKTNNVDFIQSKNLKHRGNKIPKGYFNFKDNDNIFKISDMLDCDKLKIYITPRIHGRSFINLYNLKNIQYKYCPNDRSFEFNFNDIKNKLDIISGCDIKCRYSDRFKEHKIPFYYNKEEIVKLIGWYITEGSLFYSVSKKYSNGNVRGITNRISISQSKKINPIYYEEIKEIIKKIGFKRSLSPGNIMICNSIWFDILKNNFGKGSFNKFISNNFLDNLNEHQHKILFETLLKGDGNKKGYRYTTSSEKLKNDFCKLVVRLGGTFFITKEKSYYRIHYRFKESDIRKSRRVDYIYNDYIYNVMVKDNHTLLAGSNNKFNWIGQTMYGISGNPNFVSLYNLNTASDCTSLGQQCIKYARKRLLDDGYQVLYTDTDSAYVFVPEGKTLDDVKKCAKDISKEISSNTPFPWEEFDFKVDDVIKYICFFKGNSDKLNKKNYLYITQDDKLKLKGIQIVKSNCSKLSVAIFENELKHQILKNLDCKFSKSYIVSLIHQYLERDLTLAAVSFIIKKEYASKASLQYQIFEAFGEGEHLLIKNYKLGAGKAVKYCKVEDAKKLQMRDIDIEIFIKELRPFIKDDRGRLNQYF